jgi:thymidylate kinase
MTTPVRIDLFGLPGSGKTTLAEHLCSERLADAYGLRSGYKVSVCRELLPSSAQSPCQRAPIELVGAVASLVGVQADIEHEAFVRRANEIANCYTDDSDREATVMGWIRDLVARWETVTRLLEPHEAVLCDEGFLMRANAVFSPTEPTAAIDREHVEFYVEHAPKPDLVVLLDISVEESETRIMNRADGPPVSFAGQDKQARGRRLDRMDQFIAYAANALESADVPFVRVETDGSFEAASDRLQRAIEAHR